MLHTLYVIGSASRRLFSIFGSGRVINLAHRQFSRINQCKRQYCLDFKPKEFAFNFSNLDKQEKKWNDSEGQTKGWSINSWLLIGAAIMANMMINTKAAADEKEEDKTLELEDSNQVKVTKDNFKKIKDILKEDSPLMHILEFQFSLTEKELNELFEVIKDNTELGYIAWHNDQTRYRVLDIIENKLKTNNKNYRYYPNDYVHGLLSKHVYTTSKEGTLVTLNSDADNYLKNWQVVKVFDDTDKSGYYGTIYVNCKTHQVVLANRGTEGVIAGLFDKNSDWKTNFEEILGNRIIVGQQARNLQATAEAIEIAKKAGYRLSFTGHSLGAWLAELSAYYSYAYFDYWNVKAVTFDSPGSFPMMEKLKSNIVNKNTQVKFKNIDIVTYLAGPNPANSCNMHVGKVYRVNPKMALTEKVESKVPSIVNNVWGDKIKGVLSVEGHFLNGILETFDPESGKPKECQNMLDWPKVEYIGRESFSGRGRETIKDGMNTNILSPSTQIALNLALDHVIGDSTIMTILGFLKTYIKGGIEAEQFWTYFSLIDVEKGGDEGKKALDFDKRFKLITLAHYRKGEHKHLMKLTVGSVDEYLFKLYESKDKIINNKNIPPIVKDQLEDILRSIEIIPLSKDGTTYALVAKKDDEEIIRQRMQRILLVVPKEARDISQTTVNKTIINVEADVEIRDRRLFKLPDNLPLDAPFYVEISDKRAELEEKLTTKQVVVISGPGGMGKSTLATRYGRDTKQGNEQVTWIKGMQIEEDFLQLAKLLKIGTQNLSPESIRDLVYGGFEKISKNQPILLIFDSVEKEERIEKYLINLPNQAKVIITSRNSNLFNKSQHIELKGFSEESAEKYLKLAFENIGRKVERKEVRDLLAIVGESPFRLSTAVAYLKRHSLTTISEYIKDYKVLRKGKKNDEIFPEAELLLRDLKNPESRQLLNYLAYLDIGGVGVKLILKIMGTTLDELHEFVEELEKSSLINVSDENGEKLLRVSHKIVGDETKKSLNAKDSEQSKFVLQKLIDELDAEFPDIENNPQNLGSVIKLVNHVRVVLKEESTKDSPRKENLLAKIGFYDSEIVGNYKDAIYHLEELLKYRRSKYKGNAPEISKVLDILGKTYKKLGGNDNISKGSTYQKESLNIRTQILKYVRSTYGNNHTETTKALDNLGKAYLFLGDKVNISEGLKYLEESLSVKQNLYFEDHSDVASSLHMVGRAYQALGGKENIRKGLEYQERSLKMRQNLSNKNQAQENVAQMASLYGNIGLAYQDLGGEANIRKAIYYQEMSLKMRQSLFSDLHPEVATSLQTIGIAYAKLGQEENLLKGIEYLKKSLRIRVELFPGNHSEIADLYNTIGIFYGIFDKAESLRNFQKSLEMRRALDRSNPSDKENLSQMATCLNYIGSVYQRFGTQNDVKEGLKYFIESLELRKKLFESKHRDIATSLNDVGIAYLELGGEENFRLGYKCIEESLMMQQELFLGNHSDIAKSLHSMAMAYEKLGDKDKALEYRKQAMGIYSALGNTEKANKDYQGQDGTSFNAQWIQSQNEQPNELTKLRSGIEAVHPKFFTDPPVSKILSSQCFGGNNIGFECRWIITERAENKEDIIVLKQQIQNRVLNNIVKAVHDKGWSEVNWRWIDEGVKGYIEGNYLGQILGTRENDKIEMAQMLCFESINLGIMKSDKKPYIVLQEFTRNHPELVKKIAKEHPEFFVDGSIVEACVKAMQDDATFKEHIFQHVKYMGMEAREAR